MGDTLGKVPKVKSNFRICVFSFQLDGLKFLHQAGYVHADIKGSNIVTGIDHPERVYLVDYGLTDKYSHEEGLKRRTSPMGTITFTSIDAHYGASKFY